MTLTLALAQTRFYVGNISANLTTIIEAACHARDVLGADLIVFPELTILGYPAEDLLFRQNIIDAANNALYSLAEQVLGIAIVVGYPEYDGHTLYNSAAVIHQGAMIANYRKRALPNYGVFDEQRYFSTGTQPCIFEFNGHFIGLTICEDIWQAGMINENYQAGAELLISLNASPFTRGKSQERENIIRQQLNTAPLTVIYVNQVGGQDELIFDGASFVMNQHGEIVFRAHEFTEQLSRIDFINDAPVPSSIAPVLNDLSSCYAALCLGIKDYVHKNGFHGALIGLSGGIDSALVLALAVDALGAEHVHGYLLPSRYTHTMSNEDALAEAQALGVYTDSIPIEPAVTAFTELLAKVLETPSNTAHDVTAQNIQARCRGIILMAISNKQGKLLLTTGNKSEMSVGYATLYGDMAGGFAPLKDVPKLLVYALAKYRNQINPIIPERVLMRPPSAELAPDQKDEDSLPPYPILDAILERYIEHEEAIDTIINAGFDADTVQHVVNLVNKNEHKRRQSPPGIKITRKAFGRDRRYPISSGGRPLKTVQ
jgi:NAD+ synthase (glutamine-hydrolysing)